MTGGPTTTYGYYPDGSLNTINWSPVTGQFKYSYRRNGQYETVAMPNGQTRTFAYDDQGRLTQLANAHPTAGNLASFDYAYDVNHATGATDRLGRRVSMTSTVPSQSLANALTKYVYDSTYQLTRAEYPAAAPFNGDVHNWTYDSIGNRLTATTNGTTRSYTYQKIGSNPQNWQRLASDGANSYSYDNNGSALTRATATYGWDTENRITSVAGPVSATYRYDYQGRRTAKTVNGTTTTYLYDGLSLISENGSNFVYGAGIDEPLALASGGRVAYFITDALGSVNAVADEAGVVQNNYSYDAWGTVRSATETLVQPFRYTAREVGDVSDQWFYRARDYVPSVGRFLSEDPLRQVDFTWAARYDYVRSDPVSYIDPDGYCRVQLRVVVISNFHPGIQNPCGSRDNPACTSYFGDVSCSCSQCPTSGTWNMSVSMAYHAVMQLPRNDDGRLRNHEYRHLKDMRDRFTMECARMEARQYASREECEQDCKSAQSGFKEWIKRAGEKSNEEVHKTHPRN